MNYKELIQQRYSCRHFTEKTVTPEQLTRIIQAGRVAPTAMNLQPYRIFVMDSPKAKEAVRASTHCTYGADTFLLIGAETKAAWTREFDHRNFADVDATIVATHILLAVTAEGLASTWVGHFDAPLLKERYPEMNDYDLIAIFPIGHPAEDGGPSERHTLRKEQDAVVTVL
ncbi:MAG: nitroreductase family protein [Tissierellia bacterium]|nr:nitroreductase family protein [Tissierellia bacterium]